MHWKLSRAGGIRRQRVSERRRTSSPFAIALALVPTPLLLFVSPALRLYVGNQEELYYQSSVLGPFLLLALFTAVVGALMWALSGTPLLRMSRYVTWGYLLFAPFLLAYRVLGSAASELPALVGLAVGWSIESAAGLVLWCLGWVVASVVSARRFSPSSIAKLMAAFGLVLLAGDALTFATALTTMPRPTAGSKTALNDVSVPERVATGVNVYHIVLDAFQTDVLEILRTPELDKELGGFTYFSNNRAIYHSTVMSLSSTFTSHRYLYDKPRADYIEASFRDLSTITRFANAGYWTLAVVPGSDPLETHEDGFRDVFHHVNNFERSSAANATAFRNLWMVANIPPVVLEGIAARGWLSERTQGELRRTRAGRALSDSAPVASAMSFRELIDGEEGLGNAGRYTFVHLMIPHSPYVLREDCSYREWQRAENPLAQTKCTLGLLAEFLGELDRLGRFEDSLILVHGDHGAPFRTHGNRLVRTRARSLSTPLLIKPPGTPRSRNLVVCDVDSTLLDVAPTVLDFAGLASGDSFEGSSLRSKAEFCN